MQASVLFKRIRQRLDLEPSEFVADLEQGQLAEDAYFELWDILCSSLGDETPWERVTVATVAEQEYIDLTVAQNVYRIVRIDTHLSGAQQWTPIYTGVLGSDALQVSASGWHAAESISYYPRRGLRATVAQRAAGGFAGWRLYFDPIPKAVHNVRIWYMPGPAITLEATGPDPEIGTPLTFPDDYPEFVVARVCAQLAVKQEADPGPFMAEAERIKAHIVRMNTPHQMTAPKRIVDARQWQQEDSGTHPFLRRR